MLALAAIRRSQRRGDIAQPTRKRAAAARQGDAGERHAMIASGIGYLLLSNTLTQAAAVSLGLLLVWVAATGVTLGRRSE